MRRIVGMGVLAVGLMLSTALIEPSVVLAQSKPGGDQVTRAAPRAQSQRPMPRRITGTGTEFGGGYTISRDGRRVTGTGTRFGGGHEISRDGRRTTGTGTRFGGGYDTNRTGRTIVGTGNQFGRGWTLANNGREWLGTGGNFGRRCPRTSVPPQIACP